MSLTREILDSYLYKEEVQQLARDIGLPVSRNKDEIIEELLVNPHFDPVDAVQFLRVSQLQEILRERGLPSGAARNELFDRVVALMEAERAPPMRRQRPKTPTVKVTRDEGSVVVVPPVAAAKPPNQVIIHYDASLQDHAVAWSFVALVSTGVFTGAFLILDSALGPQWGSVVGIAVCVLVAVALLLTEQRWAPFLSRLVRPVQPR